MKNYILVIAIAMTLLLTGCGGSLPTPSAPGKKPTVYIESHTYERFKNVTPEMAIWSGIPPQFLKDNRYMRCDMSDLATVTLLDNGFEVLASKKEADYTVDATMQSCGQFDKYLENRLDLPLKERALYMDLLKWVNEDEGKNYPDVLEIANLIRDGKEEGFKRFHDEKIIERYGSEFGSFMRNWRYMDRWATKYINKTKGVVLATKYKNISEKDIATINRIFKMSADYNSSSNIGSLGGVKMIGQGASMSVMASTSNIGVAAIGIGILFSLGEVSPVTTHNEFVITNNRTGKTWSHVQSFSEYTDWNRKKEKPMWDWTFDEVPWKELD